MSRNSQVPNISLLLVCLAVLACPSTNVPQDSAIDEAKAVDRGLSVPLDPNPPIRSDQVACTALTSLSASQPPFKLNAPLRAEVAKGTDRFSVKVEADRLTILTGVSFQSGDTEGSSMPIIENTNAYIKAVASGDFGVAPLETFVLNKKNGLAVWTKVRPQGITMNAPPDVQVLYFTCR